MKKVKAKTKKKTVTKRGFRIYLRLNDENESDVVVQESSSWSGHGKRCWIFATRLRDEGVPFPTSPHLTSGQARRVAKALLEFADEVEGC